jgi:hypothetical protein
MENSYMTLHKIYFILDQYGRTSYLPDNSHIEFQQKLRNELWDTVYGKVHLWPCVKLVLLRLTGPGGHDVPTAFMRITNLT